MRLLFAGLSFSIASLLWAAPPVFNVGLPHHDDATLRLIVSGDAGTGSPKIHNGIVLVAKTKKVDAILLLGDNIYPCGVRSIDDPLWSVVRNNYSDAGVPIYPVLGNHDYGDPTPQNRGTDIKCEPSPQAQIDETGHLKNWIFPARQYALRSPLADIVMLDSQPIASDWPASFLGSFRAKDEAQWADSALSESKGAWRIVVGHHTIYSSGIHGIGNHSNQRNMRRTLLPIFKARKVDLYICGHDHNAELIGKNRRPAFLIAGNGSVSATMTLRTAKDEPATDFPESFPPNPLVGFSLVEISKSELHITFYDGLGIVRSPVYVLRKSR